MFLELGRVDSKVNRESRRIYNISGMPTGSRLIYSGCNSFPEFPIRMEGDRVSLDRAADLSDLSAGSCEWIKAYSNRSGTDTGGRGYGVRTVDCTFKTAGFLSLTGSAHAAEHAEAADYFAAGRNKRSVAVFDYDED